MVDCVKNLLILLWHPDHWSPLPNLASPSVFTQLKSIELLQASIFFTLLMFELIPNLSTSLPYKRALAPPLTPTCWAIIPIVGTDRAAHTSEKKSTHLRLNKFYPLIIIWHFNKLYNHIAFKWLWFNNVLFKLECNGWYLSYMNI